MSLPWYRRLQYSVLSLRGRLHKQRGTEASAAAPVNGPEVLEKLVQLPISTWSYLWDPKVRHLGPMAQDFATAFGLGEDRRIINMVDANGVVMVAVQALHRRMVALETELAALKETEGRQSG